LTNALTASAFAAVHVFATSELLAALTFLPALAIGALYQRHRQLLPCVALHALFNGLWLLGLGALVA
jgi:membrane protease YdiL (CAAX protease family)